MSDFITDFPQERILFSSELIRIDNTTRLRVFHDKPFKRLTVFSPETVNIKKLANLTTHTKNILIMVKFHLTLNSIQTLLYLIHYFNSH